MLQKLALMLQFFLKPEYTSQWVMDAPAEEKERLIGVELLKLILGNYLLSVK
jgi:hypothetical protein